jgi:serine phosphatase RsbU (regulator of sigma subunit)
MLPILIRTDCPARVLENGGAVLGVFPDWKYENSTLQFEYGDRLLLFTDGITEAGLGGEEEFGEERLVESARECITKSASEIKSRVLADAKQFCNQQLRDDATIIVIAASQLNSHSKHNLPEELTAIS